MKNILLISALGLMMLWTSCGDKEPEINPLVGVWRLDEITLEILEDGYESNEGTGSSLHGESQYTLEFKQDFTFNRELEGSTDNLTETGVWEQDGEFIDLDPDEPKIGGLFYGFTVIEITDRELFIEYEEESSAFSDANINKWVGDGTLESTTEGLQFTVTESELDSIYNNFYDDITLVFTVNFDVKTN